MDYPVTTVAEARAERAALLALDSPREEPEAAAQMRAKPPVRFSPFDQETMARLYEDCFRLCIDGEWVCGNVMLLRDGENGRELWIHEAAKTNPRVRFMNQEALPHGDYERVARFLIGDGYLVRVCASKKTGLAYYALPFAPDAIVWWDVMTPEEWVLSMPDYDWMTLTHDELVGRYDSALLGRQMLKSSGWEVFVLPETGTLYCRKPRGA